MENIIVDVRNLELALGISLHEFEGGHTYPLSKLMNALRFPLCRPMSSGKKEKKQSRDWDAAHLEEKQTRNHEHGRKGGKYYEKTRIYNHTGLRGKRNKIRAIDGHKWRPYKRIIAPDSQVHHQWDLESASYRGMALVEADQHTHGFIDVIKILDGEITIFTEAELRGEEK